jgi:hypothetical protein
VSTPEPRHNVELYKVEFNFATQYGWQCLDCDEEIFFNLSDLEAARRSAEGHGQVIET